MLFFIKHLKKIVPLLTIVAVFLYYIYIERINLNFSFYLPNASSETEILMDERSILLGVNHIHEVYKKSALMEHYKNFAPTNVPVAVSDVNNDGYPDIFFGNGTDKKGSYLYLNQKNGTFKDVTSDYNLDKSKGWLAVTHVAAFFDFNNDGYKDLIVGHGKCHQLYLNIRGKKFKDISEESGISKICGFLTGVKVFDYNKDGYPDLYLTTLYKTYDDKNDPGITFFSPRVNKKSKNIGGPNLLLKNIGGKYFNMIGYSGLENGQLAWDSGIMDINNDGKLDVIVANDFSILKTYLNLDNDSFSNSTHLSLGKQFESANMGISFSDVNTDGFLDFFVTNISQSTYSPTLNNHLYINQKNGSFQNLHDYYSVSKCGWAWGSQFVDLNLDGNDELFVSNGMFDDGDKDYYYKWVVYTTLPTFLVKSPKTLPNTTGHFLARNQRNCLFQYNEVKNSFEDVASIAGVDDLHNGRGVALIDINNNGRTSVIVANFSAPPSFYFNQTTTKNNWIGLKLVGTNSGKDAYGAIVKIEFNDGSQKIKYHMPTQGYSSQNDPRVLIGLGNKNITSIKILWPSGHHSILSNYFINSYNTIHEDL